MFRKKWGQGPVFTFEHEVDGTLSRLMCSHFFHLCMRHLGVEKKSSTIMFLLLTNVSGVVSRVESKRTTLPLQVNNQVLCNKSCTVVVALTCADKFTFYCHILSYYSDNYLSFLCWSCVFWISVVFRLPWLSQTISFSSGLLVKLWKRPPLITKP